MKKILFMVLIFTMPDQVSSATSSGSELLEKCDAYISYMGNKQIPDSQFAHDMGICMGFIDGVVYTHNVTRSGSPIWYLPGNINPDQIIRTLVNHLRNNPDDQQKNPGSAVLIAMVNAFPCAQ